MTTPFSPDPRSPFFSRREMLPDALTVFDFAEPGFVSGSRETTNVPSQGLYMLNSPSIANAAQKLAERVTATYPGIEQRVQFAYWLVFSRGPSEAERQVALSFFSNFPGATAGKVSTDATTAAWTSFSRVLFASAEFRFLK